MQIGFVDVSRVRMNDGYMQSCERFEGVSEWAVKGEIPSKIEM